jgi:hypothetical protein
MNCRLTPRGADSAFGARCIAAFGFVCVLFQDGDQAKPALRLTQTAIRLRSPLPLVGEACRIAARR